MAQRAPRAAVIMPAYNAEKTIERTVRSILDQTVGDLLLLVVNDGSTDETAAILERLHEEDARVRPITAENGGPARARNLALDLVPPGTEYLMFSDADDLLAPDAQGDGLCLRSDELHAVVSIGWKELRGAGALRTRVLSGRDLAKNMRVHLEQSISPA